MTTAPAPEFSWTATVVHVAPELNGLTNVVEAVTWRCSYGTSAYFVQREGTTFLAPPDQASFTPFDQLDRPTVLQFARNTMCDETVARILMAEYALKVPMLAAVPQVPSVLDQMFVLASVNTKGG
ncbi:hypothetical protein [Phreatobacter stygius]|uniref:DUF7936 domain-containing protein n=1 Tax=Phreatobacter stygius TaxID=1940610 RepID=A0A4D7AWM9_9HYPH|nr:hypothetical protein [Phreatobacter stygius]QCI65529.1 hypothetical protein E8M01_15735 [Phreatobacter stygius]